MGGTDTSRRRGPTGLAHGLKEKRSQCLLVDFESVPPGTSQLAVRIFFPVDGDILDRNDQIELDKIIIPLGKLIAAGHAIRIQCVGHADVTYEPKYNQELSERRASAVEQFLRDGLKATPPRHLSSHGVGESQSRSERVYWPEDRRVDVFVKFSPKPKEKPKAKEEESPYKFQKWCDNQNLLRPLIFKQYYPKYWLWRTRGLDYLIDQYEDEDRRGGSGWVAIRSADLGKAMEVVEMLADYGDFQKIKHWVETGDRVREITTAYEVEYRKAYDEAYDRAQRDFERSDSRHSCEFFALKFGLVAKDAPYAKRSPGAPASVLAKLLQYIGIRSHKR